MTKAREIAEIRVLPPFAIARLGSSPEPMESYELQSRFPFGPRRIKAVDTLEINQRTGAASVKACGAKVSFRDRQGNIKPVAPFFEVWVRRIGEDELVPLTSTILEDAGLNPRNVKWNVQVANWKAFRRTGDIHDCINASSGSFSDHKLKRLVGRCDNFLKRRTVPLGSVRYIKPTEELPQIRLRFTPAAGKVYGPPLSRDHRHKGLIKEVYDPKKGKWKGYRDPTNPKIDDPVMIRRTTLPPRTYAADGSGKSLGYLDDECDGIVKVEIKCRVTGKSRSGTLRNTRTKTMKLSAFARIVVGPPTFAPDSLPVRTIYDDIEQAILGPKAKLPVNLRTLKKDVREIVTRALETVRLTNTFQMNKALRQTGVGMARMDFFDVGRALEPIADPEIADSLAIQTRHERLLVALDSGSPAWFARVLRDYDQVGDLSNEGRRRMPALLRGSDSRHLALTRLQVSRVRAAAELIAGKPKRRKRK